MMGRPVTMHTGNLLSQLGQADDLDEERQRQYKASNLDTSVP